MAYWREGGGNAMIDLATGLGKSVVIGKLVKDLLTEYPAMRILCLVHVRELVQQDYQALIRLWPQAPAGIYSAGLGRRDARDRITFASIQSVYRKAQEIGPRHLVLIDEAHLVPNGGDGMYRKLLADLREMVPDLRVAGFTATPYRMDSGRLDDDGGLFDQVVYSYGVGAGIDDGWLSPLTGKVGSVEIDVSSVGSRGGEFIAGQLEAAADDERITRAAVADMLARASDRRSWLVFCSGVKHALHVRDALNQSGVRAECVTGDTPPGERDHIIREFRAGRIRALTSMAVLTTGFDAPNVDMIAFLRPTRSTGLFVQMVGRGTRLCEGKANCLILDYAGNVRRFGPVDAIEIETKRKGKGSVSAPVDRVMAKACPECDALAALNARVCKDCGHEWPANVEHDTRADDAPILTREMEPAKPESLRVQSWSCRPWNKPGAPTSLRVDYLAGLMAYPEWVAFEHGGYPKRKAGEWWRMHGGQLPVPETVEEATVRWPELTPPETINVKKEGKWWSVTGRRFAVAGEEAAA